MLHTEIMAACFCDP